jgi:alpha-ribazole phosphatase
MASGVVYAWRHPRPQGAEGRCIGGRTDLPVDPRRAKRLAHRIRRWARREQLPRVVATSPLLRCAAVGRWLKRWGWVHHVDADLIEVDFGAWDGEAWASIARIEIDAWCADLHRHAPGGGEPVVDLLRRVASWRPGGAACVVTHGGWLAARHWLSEHPGGEANAADWPTPPAYGQRLHWRTVPPACTA